jgi:uncharacterized protein (AIM24 family)
MPLKVHIHGDVASILLEQGQKLRAQTDSCIGRTATMSTGLTGEGDWLVTRLARSAMNKAFGGENMLSEWFEGHGEVLIADPLFPGRIAEIELSADDVLYFKQGAWLASDANVVITPTFDSLSSVALNALKGAPSSSLILQAKRGAQEDQNEQVQGQNDQIHNPRFRVYFNSFGTIYHRKVLEDETYHVDTKNILGWTNSSQSLALAGGLINSVATGEGFEYQFQGPCDVFVQSGSKELFLGALVNSPQFMQELAGSETLASYVSTQLEPAKKRTDELQQQFRALKAVLRSASRSRL